MVMRRADLPKRDCDLASAVPHSTAGSAGDRRLNIAELRLLLASTSQPQEGVFEEKVLRGVVEDAIAVPHVHIDHFVSSIGPNHGQVSIEDRVFQAERVIGGIERK
jgi:hypothetical protein